MTCPHHYSNPNTDTNSIYKHRFSFCVIIHKYALTYVRTDTADSSASWQEQLYSSSMSFYLHSHPTLLIPFVLLIYLLPLLFYFICHPSSVSPHDHSFSTFYFLLPATSFLSSLILRLFPYLLILVPLLWFFFSFTSFLYFISFCSPLLTSASPFCLFPVLPPNFPSHSFPSFSFCVPPTSLPFISSPPLHLLLIILHLLSSLHVSFIFLPHFSSYF